MPTLRINQKQVTVPEGTTILTAAQQVGIHVPTLCFLNGYQPFTSCMICVVEEQASGRLLPACSALAQEGMVIQTENEQVFEYRKQALELLLSEHLGDCEAPCQRTCPANMNIPLMLRQIAANQLEEALITVKKDIALPAVLGRICPAPCEKGCRRSQYDAAVSICLLKAYVADVDLAQPKPYLPPTLPATGKKIAIVGAGPTGLAAAYYLLPFGHECTIFDQQASAGGNLRTAIPAERLPREILEAEIEIIRQLGAEFKMGVRVGADVTLTELQTEFDAVILACGQLARERLQELELQLSKQGVAVNPKTFETSTSGIFAGGAVIKPIKMAVQAVAQGKALAQAINQFLTNQPLVGAPAKKFNSQLGKLPPEEIPELLKESVTNHRQTPAAGNIKGFTLNEAVTEAQRCLHCDCRKPVSCKLRHYAQQYQARPQPYKSSSRHRFIKVLQHADIIYEPGKCIKCGLCVQITEKADEKLGLTFIGRGFNVRIGVPFNDSLARGLEQVAAECVRHCPTGALAWRHQEETLPQ